MNWEQVIPNQVGRRHTTKDAQKYVRVSFSRLPVKKDGISDSLLKIFIGTDITTRLNLSKNVDSIDLFIDKDKPTRWLIKKSPLNSKIGFRQAAGIKGDEGTLVFQLRWHSTHWAPTEGDHGIRRLSHVFEDGGFIVDFEKTY